MRSTNAPSGEGQSRIPQASSPPSGNVRRQPERDSAPVPAVTLGPVGRRRFSLEEIAWRLHCACRRNVLRYSAPGRLLRPKYLSFIASPDVMEWLDIELIFLRYASEQGPHIAWSLRVAIPEEWREVARSQPGHTPHALAAAQPLAAPDGALLSYCSDRAALAEAGVVTENSFVDGVWLDDLWQALQQGQPSALVIALETQIVTEDTLLDHLLAEHSGSPAPEPSTVSVASTLGATPSATDGSEAALGDMLAWEQSDRESIRSLRRAVMSLRLHLDPAFYALCQTLSEDAAWISTEQWAENLAQRGWESQTMPPAERDALHRARNLYETQLPVAHMAAQRTLECAQRLCGALPNGHLFEAMQVGAERRLYCSRCGLEQPLPDDRPPLAVDDSSEEADAFSPDAWLRRASAADERHEVGNL